MYADFQSLLKGVRDSDKENNTTYTEKSQKHIPCSFAYIAECFDDKFSKQVVLFSRKMQSISLLNQFFKSMIIAKSDKKHFNKNLLMSKKMNKDFSQAKVQTM